ncbi:nucleosidase [Streptomyces sp. NPDC126514]|uniref:5'-methylthioadenosine/S-adenosylhomocysteine nucleosidase family protein n=1 Tax=Streptomyces sp. NPDC126514 TaxID=3155210 RepID=UPI003330A6CB
MPYERPFAAVVTGLPLEYESMRSLLTGLRREQLSETLSTELGDLPDSPWQVALAKVSSHRDAAILDFVVRQLRPDALLFVGIAGSLRDDVVVGDLVVATRTYAFQGGKQTPEGFYARPQSWHPSHRMEQVARSALRGEFRVHFRAVAAGDITLNDEHSSLLNQLKRHYNDAVAIEMESAGIAHAAHLTAGVDTLTIRGISDVADAARMPKDHQRAQARAAARAAQAAAVVLRALKPPPPRPTHVAYGGDHVDFHGSTFFGPAVGKIVPRGDG